MASGDGQVIAVAYEFVGGIEVVDLIELITMKSSTTSPTPHAFRLGEEHPLQTGLMQTRNESSSQPQSQKLKTEKQAQAQSENEVIDSKLRLLAESDTLVDPQDWPTLRTHIQSRLRASIQTSFPSNPTPKLHPQATSQTSNQNHNQTLIDVANQNAANTAETASNSLNSRFVSESSSSADPQDSTAPTDASSQAALVTSEASTTTPLNPKNPPTTFHIPGLAPIESSMFFAAKRQPGHERNYMWSKAMAKGDVEKEVQDLCEILDGFISSPPFTIQRLSELILKPELYHTPSKYLSSLRRVLSVTAERGSFPAPSGPGVISSINPITPLESSGVNGILASGIHSDSSSSQAFHPNSLFQSTNVNKPNGIEAGGSSPRIPYTRNNDPIFSPIPFLVRDDLKMESGEEDIPRMELEGSEGQAHDPEAEAPNSSIEDVERQTQSETPMTQSVDQNELSGSDSKAKFDEMTKVESAPPTTSSNAISSDPNAVTPIETSNANPSTMTDTTPSAHGHSLGVPHGRVDELDDLPKVSLTSTSSSQNSASPSTSSLGPTSSNAPKNETSSSSNQSDRDSQSTDSNRGKLSSGSEIRPISSTTTMSSGNLGDGEREIKRIKSSSSLRSDRSLEAEAVTAEASKGEAVEEQKGREQKQRGGKGREVKKETDAVMIDGAGAVKAPEGPEDNDEMDTS